MTTVDLGGITFQPDASSGFVFQKLTDWDTIPDSKSEVRERPQAHGSFGIDQDWRQSLAISLEGVFLGGDEAEAAAAKQALRRALGGGVSTTITVTDALGATSRDVSIRKVTVVDDTAPDEWRFAVDMIAGDYRRYGSWSEYPTGLPVDGAGLLSPLTSPLTQVGGGNPGRAVITNAGSAETAPELEVTGGLSGGVELIRIETGERIRLEWPLALGDVARFDMAEGQVWLNGQSVISGYLTRAEWWALGPGETATVQFVGLGTVTGTPTLTARWRDAY